MTPLSKTLQDNEGIKLILLGISASKETTELMEGLDPPDLEFTVNSLKAMPSSMVSIFLREEALILRDTFLTGKSPEDYKFLKPKILILTL